MRMRVGALVLVTASSGCLPGRENPHDPAVSPSAALIAVDQTLEDGTCPLDPSSAAGLEVDEASRGRCLALDASSSTDPQDDSLRYRFFIEEGDDWRELEYPEGVEDTLGVFVLDATERKRHPAPLDLRFRVRVRDGSGAYDDAETSLRLDNVRPVARVNPMRVLPLGGYGWDDGSDPCYTVTFDASDSSDEDDDQLTFQWAFVPAQNTTLCGPAAVSTQSTITFRIPVAQYGRTAALLTANDGLEESLKVSTSVSVRKPEILELAQVEDLFGGVLVTSRIDSSFEALSGPGSSRQDLTAARVGSDLVAMAWTDTAGVSHIGRADLADIDTLLDGPAPFPDVTNASLHGRDEEVWKDVAWSLELGLAFTPGDEFLKLWNLAGTPTPGAPIDVMDWVLPEATQVAVDSNFNVWLSHFMLGDALVRISPDGVEVPLREPQADPVRALSGISARPGSSGEVWVTEVSNAFGAGDGELASVLRYGSDLSLEEFELEIPFVVGLAWINEDEFWLGVPGEGMRLIDASSLALGLEAATLLRVPMVASPFLLATDPITGTCYVATLEGTGAIVYLDGSSTVEGDSVYVALVQDDGRNWRYVQGDLFRGFTTSPTGTYAPVFRTSSFLGAWDRPVRDARSGGFWLSGAFGGLELYSADGRGIETLLTMFDTEQGIERPIPLMRRVMRLDPDGSHLWYFGEDSNGNVAGLFRMDMQVRPPVAKRILPAAEATAILPNDQRPIFEAADPAAAAPFVWVSHETGGNTLTIALLSTSGTMTDKFTYPAGEFPLAYYPRAKRVPRSNRLCLAQGDVGGGAPNVYVRMLDPTAVDPVLMEVVLPLLNDDRFASLTATRDPVTGEEVCWFQVSDLAGECDDPSRPGVNRVRGFKPNGSGGGTLVASLDDLTGDGFNLAAAESGIFWMESRRCDENSDRKPFKVALRRIGATLVEETQFDPSGDVMLGLFPPE